MITPAKPKLITRCQDRYCLRQTVEIKPNKIQRKFQPVKQRSRTIAIASEQPVERWCERRLRVVREVLTLDGIELRGNSRRISVVDSNRNSVRNVVGSVANLRKQNGQLVGEITWARCKRSQVIQAKWQDAHLDCFEVESEIHDLYEYPTGSKWRNIEGPVDVVTRWQPIVAVVKAVQGD